MDDLSSHKSKAVRHLIRAVGAKFFILPNTRRTSSIEQVFAKIKRFLCKVAARSGETICMVIGEILRASHPTNEPATFKIPAMRNLKASLYASV
jgi:transposase